MASSTPLMAPAPSAESSFLPTRSFRWEISGGLNYALQPITKRNLFVPPYFTYGASAGEQLATAEVEMCTQNFSNFGISKEPSLLNLSVRLRSLTNARAEEVQVNRALR